MDLSLIISRAVLPADWQTWSKIPWDEPGFSARMLENHLSQEHDWASRTNTAIDAQVAFIHRHLPPGARILDLGCGPGLYTERLAALGHVCTGVDFSPASISYAQRQPSANRITYIQEDARRFQAAGTFDAVLLLFGEINAFSRQDAGAILKNAIRALHPGGKLFIETHTFDAVKEIGFLPSTWQTLENGLFSEKPHLYLEEHFWNEALSIAMTRYYIADAEPGGITEYSALMQAYSDAQYAEMFKDAGLADVRLADAADWPAGTAFAGKLRCFVGTVPSEVNAYTPSTNPAKGVGFLSAMINAPDARQALLPLNQKLADGGGQFHGHEETLRFFWNGTLRHASAYPASVQVQSVDTETRATILRRDYV